VQCLVVLLLGFILVTSKASNLVWSTDGYEIFVDYVGSGQLFVDFYFLKTFVNFLHWMF
jgi:hypothetical protein